jgi:hypothetical protein
MNAPALRALIAACAGLVLCAPLALAQRTETTRPVTETKAKTLPERSMTMEQEEAARRARARREEEQARREAWRLQQQENLRRQRAYPAYPPTEVIVEPQPAPAPPPATGMGGAAPVTAPATAPAPSGGIVVTCSAAPTCPSAAGGYGNVCKSVEQTYGGGNAISVGRRDIVTVCQQANSPEACGLNHPGGPAAGIAYRNSFGGGCIQQCVNAGRCTAQNASSR